MQEGLEPIIQKSILQNHENIFQETEVTWVLQENPTEKSLRKKSNP